MPFTSDAMIYKKRLLSVVGFLVFFLLFVSQSGAQQQVVGSSGGDIKSEDGWVNWTLGEPVVNTIKGDVNLLTQGFHQSQIIITEIKNNFPVSYNINIYPNPVETTLIIQIENSNISNTSYNLINTSGKVVKSGCITTTYITVSVRDIAPSVYFMEIFEKNKCVRTFKIVKR